MRVVCRWYGKKKYKMVSEQSENRTRTITQKNGSKYKRATTHIVCKDAACERRQRDASDAVKHELDTDALMRPQPVCKNVRNLHFRHALFAQQHQTAALVRELHLVDLSTVGAREDPLEPGERRPGLERRLEAAPRQTTQRHLTQATHGRLANF